MGQPSASLFNADNAASSDSYRAVSAPITPSAQHRTVDLVRRYRYRGNVSLRDRLSPSAVFVLAVSALSLVIGAAMAPLPGNVTINAAAISQLVSADAVARQIIITVDDFLERHGQLPDSIEQAGFTLPARTSIARVEIQPESGVMHVLLKQAQGEPLSLVYARVAGASDEPEWQCSGGPEVDPALLPQGCGAQPDPGDEL